jgi:hypothetical protein
MPSEYEAGISNNQLRRRGVLVSMYVRMYACKYERLYVCTYVLMYAFTCAYAYCHMLK